MFISTIKGVPANSSIHKDVSITNTQIMDVWNVVVVVSRWFGGTHIGPDRFKHINAATREVLIKGGFYSESEKKKK